MPIYVSSEGLDTLNKKGKKYLYGSVNGNYWEFPVMSRQWLRLKFSRWPMQLISAEKTQLVLILRLTADLVSNALYSD